MKKALFFTALLSLVASSAMAVDTTGRFGLGFVDNSTPIGGRYWFSEKIGFDFGLGVTSTDLGDSTSLDFRFGVGLPIVMMNAADRVNMMFEPRLEYAAFDVPEGTGAVSSVIQVGVGLEFEVFVTNDFSVSAAQGIFFNIEGREDFGTMSVDSTTDWGTFGSDLTEFGFHYYLGGGK